MIAHTRRPLSSRFLMDNVSVGDDFTPACFDANGTRRKISSFLSRRGITTHNKSSRAMTLWMKLAQGFFPEPTASLIRKDNAKAFAEFDRQAAMVAAKN